MPFLLDRRVKRIYSTEIIRRYLLFEGQGGGMTKDGYLDVRVRRLRQMHDGAFGKALYEGRTEGVYGPYGDPRATAALERTLLEPWSQRFLSMSAGDVLAHAS